MSENVRGPIIDHVLTYACDKCREVSPTVVPRKRVRQFTKRYCNSIDIKLVCSYFKIRNVWCERPHPSWAPYVCGLQVFYVRAVMPAMSAKPLSFSELKMTEELSKHVFKRCLLFS